MTIARKTKGLFGWTKDPWKSWFLLPVESSLGSALTYRCWDGRLVILPALLTWKEIEIGIMFMILPGHIPDLYTLAKICPTHFTAFSLGPNVICMWNHLQTMKYDKNVRWFYWEQLNTRNWYGISNIRPITYWSIQILHFFRTWHNHLICADTPFFFLSQEISLVGRFNKLFFAIFYHRIWKKYL